MSIDHSLLLLFTMYECMYVFLKFLLCFSYLLLLLFKLTFSTFFVSAVLLLLCCDDIHDFCCYDFFLWCRQLWSVIYMNRAHCTYSMPLWGIIVNVFSTFNPFNPTLKVPTRAIFCLASTAIDGKPLVFK